MQVVEQLEKIRFNPNLTTNSFYALRQFVKRQLGITFLPAFVVTREIESGELFALPVAHPVLEKAEAHLIKRSGRKLSFAANKMLQLMGSEMRSLS